MTGNEADNGDNGESESGLESDEDVHEVSLSVDAILSLLANHQRRDLLQYFLDVPDRTATVDECISHLLERCEERTGERPAHDRIEAALYHIHIPKLVEAGVVEYDARSRDLRYRGHERLEEWLARIREETNAAD